MNYLFKAVWLLAWPLITQAADFPQELSEVIARYASAKTLRLTLDKDVTVAALGRHTQQSGRAFLSGGLLRLELDEPNKSLLVVDRQHVWIVSYDSAELGGGVQVGRSKKQAGKKPPVLFRLLTERTPQKEFKLIKSEGKQYEIEPKTPDQDVKSVRLTVDGKKLAELSYQDELGNETRYHFKKTEFDASLDPKLFRYTPPKGTKITEY